MNQEAKVYSIKELNGVIKSAVDSAFGGMIWVQGEIQDLKISAKRNIYFNLVQKKGKSAEVEAQIQGFIFDNIKPRIEKRLNTTDIASVLKKDMEVKFLCKVQFYAKSAKCSLTVYDIDPEFLLGQMAINKEKIIKQLQKENLLEKNKQNELSLLPLNVGLITSYDTAAFHDFTDELNRSGYGFNVRVFDAHMQGDMVEKDILKALKGFASAKVKPDVVVITRGGGSTADLSYFDSEKIARAVTSMKLPVLSAIGHQINMSILEVVSYENFKTPTKVAQHIVVCVDDFVNRINAAEEIIKEKPLKTLEDIDHDLRFKAVNLSKFTSEYFFKHKQDLIEVATLLRNTSLSKNKSKIENLENSVNLLDPINILKRGFSITLAGDKALKDVNEVNKDDIIHTVLYNGSIDSVVVDDAISTHPSVSVAKQPEFTDFKVKQPKTKVRKAKQSSQLDLFDVV